MLLREKAALCLVVACLISSNHPLLVSGLPVSVGKSGVGKQQQTAIAPPIVVDSNVPGDGGAIYCDSQKELFTGFNFIKQVCCDQLGETCPVGSVLPSTCKDPACARAVNVVARGCLPWLAQHAQAWLQSFATCGHSLQSKSVVLVQLTCCACIDRQLSAVHKACAATSSAANTIVLSNRTGYIIKGVCGATLIAGKLENQKSWRDDVTIIAQQPFGLLLQFQSFYLPEGDLLNVFDGTPDDDRLIVRLRGTR